jgi:hypothetical protein
MTREEIRAVAYEKLMEVRLLTSAVLPLLAWS